MQTGAGIRSGTGLLRPRATGAAVGNGNLDFATSRSCLFGRVDKAPTLGFTPVGPLRTRHVRPPTSKLPLDGHSELAASAANSASVSSSVRQGMLECAARGAGGGGGGGGGGGTCFRLQTGEVVAPKSQTLASFRFMLQMDPSVMEHSVQPQNAGESSEQNMENVAPVVGSRVVEPEISLEPARAQIALGKIGDGVQVMHADMSLRGCTDLSHVDVDGRRDASHGHDEKQESDLLVETSSRTEQFPQVSEFGGNSEAPKESNVTRPDVEQHLVRSDNVGYQNPPLPEQLQGEVVKADQNGTPTNQPSMTPGFPSESPSNSAVARDTSSIPGISMLANQSIPAAVFKQEEVVASKEVFAEALNKFHTVLGTRLTKKGRGGRERAAEVKTFEESIAGIPKLGGHDLDLHLLYVEVTSRGGLEQVIKDRKWKEVTNCLKFAETITSASYILRKYYVGLLYYFEQAYLHGKTGPLIPPPISMPGPSPLSVKRSDSAVGLAFPPTEGQPSSKRSRKRKILPIQAVPAVDPTLSVGVTVRSTIEGKFEHGYLVSVTVGTEKMRGLIYHVPPMQRAPQHASIPNYESTIGAEPILIREEPSLRKMKRKRRRADDMPKKDPNAPRPNRTGYNFFFAEKRAKLKALHPEKDKELSRMIGDAWNKLTEEEKTPYQDRGVQDKERYKIELRKYLELLKSQNGSIPMELAAEHEVDDAKEKLKEAVVDAAIDVAVDVAVNNAVDVAVDDVVNDVTTKSVTTDAPVGNHHFPTASDDTGKAVTDTTNGSYNPVAVEGNTANTVPVAPVGNDNLLDVDDGIPNSISEAPDGSVNLLATIDFDIEQQPPL